MKISSRAKYAVRLMVELDRQGALKRPIQLARISEKTGISKRYLEQLAIALKSHSLIRGVAGRNGGYMLIKTPDQISIGAVLKALNGPINLSLCVVEPSTCMRADFCECRLIWSLLTKRVNAVLEEFSIADLSDKSVMEEVRLLMLGPADTRDGDMCGECGGAIHPEQGESIATSTGETS